MQETEYNWDDDPQYNLTAEDIKVFNERRKRRLSGESKTYCWKDAKEIITAKKPIILFNSNKK
jgi:hypothetical protein